MDAGVVRAFRLQHTDLKGFDFNGVDFAPIFNLQYLIRLLSQIKSVQHLSILNNFHHTGVGTLQHEDAAKDAGNQKEPQQMAEEHKEVLRKY